MPVPKGETMKNVTQCPLIVTKFSSYNWSEAERDDRIPMQDEFALAPLSLDDIMKAIREHFLGKTDSIVKSYFKNGKYIFKLSLCGQYPIINYKVVVTYMIGRCFTGNEICGIHGNRIRVSVDKDGVAKRGPW